jgi:uncharacterized membrane protein
LCDKKRRKRKRRKRKRRKRKRMRKMTIFACYRLMTALIQWTTTSIQPLFSILRPAAPLWPQQQEMEVVPRLMPEPGFLPQVSIFRGSSEL